MIEFKITHNWDEYLSHFPSEKKDIYFEEKYVKLYETDKEKATCFVCHQDDNYFIFPYLIRSFKYRDTIYYDFETPYGYGGPICNCNNEDFLIESLHIFNNYCKSNNYISGFVRFHPLLQNGNCFNSIGNLIDDRSTIAIDISLTETEIWMNEIHTKNRNTIKNAQKNQLKFIADYEFEYLDQFIHLYDMTMNKLDADNFYYFDKNYYSRFKDSIQNSFIGLVLYNDIIISGAIFFYSDVFAHYHLSGSDINYLSLYPNNFMLWEAILELKKHHLEKFHLGGGINSERNNSLYEFKRKFSKSKYQFQIGKLIFNHDIYQMLCHDWICRNPEKAQKYNHHLLKYKY